MVRSWKGLPAVIAAGAWASFAAFATAADQPAPADAGAAPAAAADTAAPAPADAPADPATAPAEAAPATDAAAPAAAPAAEPAPAAAVPEKSAAAPSTAPAAASKAADLVLGSPVVGADGKEVGKLNRVRSGADGTIAEIHVKTGNQTIVAVPGNNVASGGAQVTLTVSSGDVAKMPPVGNNG